MENQKIREARTYLLRFDEILYQMAHKMLSASVINNITLYFIECMVPHHQAAIYMSENLLQYTNDASLRKIAEGIIQMQTKGIAQMREIARTTQGYDSSRQDTERYYEKYLAITQNMICRMKNSPRCANINLDFVNEMIPHHEGAIEMCHNLLQYEIDPRLKMVAQTIIREQSNGIKQLEVVRNDLCK